MKLLSKISEKIYDRIESKGFGEIFVHKELVGKLYVNEDPQRSVREKGTLMISRMILIILVTLFICAVIVVADKAVLGEDNTLARSGAGEGDRSYELEVSVEGGGSEKVQVLVTEREVKADNIPKVFDLAEDLLLRNIAGDNPSLSQVTSSLDLKTKVEGTKVLVTWEADKDGFFSGTGRLRVVPPDSETVTLYATLHYFDHSRRIPVWVTVVPPPEKKTDESQKRIGVLNDVIREADQKDPASEKIYLPNTAGDERLEWKEPFDTRPIVVGLLGIVSAVMLAVRAKSSMREEGKKRREQMERDYPEIISKLILLLTAGMTCSGAWKRICTDYVAAKPHLGKRFAYEEMIFSLRELELGRSEAAVYESFGNRTGVLCYKRLSAMLARNLRRGSREILTMLDLESRDAYAARFEAVRKKGEETSTKLLLPMMGMLIIVIAIIVVPAFMGMGI
ncbi:MAG: hypothetical protein K6F93_06915 [Lachnospiraceae bacterium]|nr:hypothetical protein [Lachnospiraceae bacterium]